MKKSLSLLWLLSACTAAGAELLLADGSYPAGSARADRFVQGVNNAHMIFKGSSQSFTIEAGQTIHIPGGEVYTLDSVQDETHAFLTRPIFLRNGVDTFPGYAGAIFSNNTLYLAGYKTVIRQDGEDTSLRLQWAKQNVNFQKIGTNTDGSYKEIAVRP